MSRYWTSVVFFDRQAMCTMEFLCEVVNAMQKSGLTPNQPGTGWTLGSYFQMNGDYDAFELPDLAASLSILVDHQGGSIALWYPVDELRVDVNIYPSGYPNSSPEADSAYVQFGWASLAVESTYLTEVPRSIARDQHLRIFQWSLLLASTTRALYGWGDLDRSGEFDSTVRASDLTNFNIPRVSWWAYYGKEFVRHRDKALLHSPGISWIASDAPGEEGSYVVILQPPEYPKFSTGEDGVVVA